LQIGQSLFVPIGHRVVAQAQRSTFPAAIPASG
jgi:hypothetical protein